MPIDLCTAAFASQVQNGIRYFFIDCNHYLVDFFTGLGFIEYMSPKVHKEYGEVHLMRLDLEDHAHLRRLGSPFCRVIDGKPQLEP